MINNALKSLKTLGVHPFVYFFKFILFLHKDTPDH